MKSVRNTITGVDRCYVMRNVACKLRHHRTRIGNDSTGRFINAPAGFQPDGTVDAFCALMMGIFHNRIDTQPPRGIRWMTA